MCKNGATIGMGVTTHCLYYPTGIPTVVTELCVVAVLSIRRSIAVQLSVMPVIRITLATMSGFVSFAVCYRETVRRRSTLISELFLVS